MEDIVVRVDRSGRATMENVVRTYRTDTVVGQDRSGRTAMENVVRLDR